MSIMMMMMMMIIIIIIHTIITEILPIYYLLNAFNNFFPNNKLLPTTTQEIEKFIKSLKPMNTYGYDKIPTNLPKIKHCLLVHL
jgi:hypothetical protein